MSISVYEITAFGFWGGTDATDDRVLHVAALSKAELSEAIKGTGAKVWGMIHFDHLIDFTFPAEREALIEKLNFFKNEAPGQLLEEESGWSADELITRYDNDGAGEHPWHTQEKWRKEVAYCNVTAGYWHWVSYMLGGNDLQY